MTTNQINHSKGLLSLPVIVAALGYFVDIYDLTVFGILRKPSLSALGLDETSISVVGTEINNWQLAGIVIGGIVWGIIGDKKGRLTILFGSILTYSLANIACGFVQDVNTYKLFRFIAGLGLAGELGAGITLVAEVLPKEKRSFATSIVTGFGLLGAAFAFYTQILFDWRTTYFIGGGLGIFLLILRLNVFESTMFDEIAQKTAIKRGNFWEIIKDKKLFQAYLFSFLVAVPIYYFYGIFAFFGNEMAQALHVIGEVKSGAAIMWYYIGLALGDFFSGPISYLLKSRKKVIFTMLSATVFLSLYLLLGNLGIQATTYYFLCTFGGITTGYWAMFILMTAETFPTRLRATATTSLPNLVRFSLVGITMAYQSIKVEQSAITSALVVGVFIFGLAYFSLYMIQETFNNDLKNA